METLVITPKAAASPKMEHRAIDLCLLAYMVAVIPFFLESSSKGVASICASLALWRIAFVHGGCKNVPTLMVSILSTLFIAVLLLSHEFQINTQTGVLSLMILLGFRNLISVEPSQFTNNLFLLPFIPTGFLLNADPSWFGAYLLGFLWVWLVALQNTWSSNVGLKTSVFHGLRTLLLFAPFIIGAYFLLPRPTPMWNNDEPQGKTGMSSTLKPGDVGKLSQNHATAFIVSFPKGLPPLVKPEMMYWRGLTLSEYKNGEWSRHSAKNLSYFQQEEPIENGIEYKILFPEKSDAYLYSLEYSTIKGIPLDEDGTSMVPKDVKYSTFKSYSATHYPNSVLDIAPTKSETSLLQNDNPKATALAKELWAQTKTPDAFLERLKAYVQSNNFVYSLEPGSMKESWIDTFLERKKGFCEHYAGTASYMLRQVGVPTRVVVGFQGSKPATSTNYLEIPYSAAHAWLEYWSATSNKWVRLDPTGWVAPERLTAMHWDQPDVYKASSWLGQLGFIATQFDTQWKTWVTYYDADQQRLLWKKMGNANWLAWSTLALTLAAFVWFGTGKRWYAFSFKPLHQWIWLLKKEGLPSSTSVGAYRTLHRDTPMRLLEYNTWLHHVEDAVYGNKKSTMLNYRAWLGLLRWIQMKNLAKKFNNNPFRSKDIKINLFLNQ